MWGSFVQVVKTVDWIASTSKKYLFRTEKSGNQFAAIGGVGDVVFFNSFERNDPVRAGRDVGNVGERDRWVCWAVQVDSGGARLSRFYLCIVGWDDSRYLALDVGKVGQGVSHMGASTVVEEPSLLS